jgi:hypothetical protein
VQYICHERLRVDGSKDAQTSSDEESEAEVGGGGSADRKRQVKIGSAEIFAEGTAYTTTK